MTQPQPHQRPPAGGAPDTLNPAALQRLLELREHGPHSPALPDVDFTRADYPLDLVVAIEQLIHQSANTDGRGRVAMIQVLAAASNLLARITVLVGGALHAGEPLPTSDNGTDGPAWQPDGEEKAELAAMLYAVSCAEHNLSIFLSPMLRCWLQSHAPAALAAGESGDYAQAHQALISDAIFEMLQMSREDFRIAAEAPVVDS